jgi:multidrug transporter EmrE-like cation transporter
MDWINKIIKKVNWRWGSFSFLPIFFGTILSIIDIAMMGLAKMVSIGSLTWNFGVPLAIVIYALEPIVFLKALDYEGMAVTNLVWNLISNIVVTLQGVIIFGENIKNIRWVATAMSLVALALFAYSDN